MITLELTVGEAIEVFTLLQRATSRVGVLRVVWPDVDLAKPELDAVTAKLDQLILDTLQNPETRVDARAQLQVRKVRAAQRSSCPS